MNRETGSRIGRAVRAIQAHTGPVDDRRYHDDGGVSVPMFGKVISSTPITPVKWSYTIQPVRFDLTVGQFGDFVNDGPVVTSAKNLTEWNNNATGTNDCGNGVRSTSLSGGYTIKPASVGTPIVRIFKVGAITVFSLTNGTDKP